MQKNICVRDTTMYLSLHCPFRIMNKHSIFPTPTKEFTQSAISSINSTLCASTNYITNNAIIVTVSAQTTFIQLTITIIIIIVVIILRSSQLFLLTWSVSSNWSVTGSGSTLGTKEKKVGYPRKWVSESGLHKSGTEKIISGFLFWRKSHAIFFLSALLVSPNNASFRYLFFSSSHFQDTYRWTDRQTFF